MTDDSFDDVVCVFEGGVRVTIKAQPGRSSARRMEVVDIGNGKRAVAVTVAERAAEGKANRAIIERLSDEWGVSRKQIEIKSGETGRLKIVEVHGNGLALKGVIVEFLNARA